MTQLTLPGFEATPQLPAHRLFLAVKPDAETAQHIARLIEQLRPVVGFKGKALRAERLHVTLHHVGDFVQPPPDDLVARVRAAAEGLALPAFDASFNQVVSFHGRRDHRPFVLLGNEGVAELMAFQSALGDALLRAGVPVSHGHFKPHITLLYDRGGFAPKPVEPITWTVREFVLIHSWLGKTRYDELGRWALKG
ncbi:RNA 2',3'-cyclic phosphodiesterase [Ralstonia sp. 25C]|uniref:RNA 2',3'-cyclic phosphodiesterase n=1 Tax=Ralstonia sp. 25C TaxID=3447363 RepID=UPI003F756D7C